MVKHAQNQYFIKLGTGHNASKARTLLMEAGGAGVQHHSSSHRKCKSRLLAHMRPCLREQEGWEVIQLTCRVELSLVPGTVERLGIDVHAVC